MGDRERQHAAVACGLRRGGVGWCREGRGGERDVRRLAFARCLVASSLAAVLSRAAVLASRVTDSLARAEGRYTSVSGVQFRVLLRRIRYRMFEPVYRRRVSLARRRLSFAITQRQNVRREYTRACPCPCPCPVRISAPDIRRRHHETLGRHFHVAKVRILKKVSRPRLVSSALRFTPHRANRNFTRIRCVRSAATYIRPRDTHV